jgi:hypothetical protein
MHNLLAKHAHSMDVFFYSVNFSENSRVKVTGLLAASAKYGYL